MKLHFGWVLGGCRRRMGLFFGDVRIWKFLESVHVGVSGSWVMWIAAPLANTPASGSKHSVRAK